MYGKRKALLIQDVFDYLCIIRMHLRTIMPDYAYIVDSEHAVLEWIIKEEIESIFAVNCVDHDYRAEPYRTIYGLLTNQLQGRATTFFSSVVNIPRIYNFDTLVKVQLVDRDLYVYYEQ